ncbi:Ubiquitin-conjugating enzyme E2 2 [Echinococcus granulosus]|nr:Ubiquitin-conjugating enzyme E2 2 [Echinococcus granulosus]CDS15688.1 ubiquitin conjugating enzyme morgue [Echinococcus granulosus]
MGFANDTASRCRFCNEQFDCWGEQPVCRICHAFLYDYATSDILSDIKSSDEKEASNDSGTEELESETDQRRDSHTSSFRCNTASNSSHSVCPFQRHMVPPSWLNKRFPCMPTTSNSPPNYTLEKLPKEILIRLFDYLDDFSIWGLRLASSRLRAIIDSEITEARWASFVAHRWPIFVPRHRISSWRLLYLNMMDSVTCSLCLSRIHFPTIFPIDIPGVRFRRIISEIRSLCADPPYGIKALALDTDTYAHCLAGIAGPPASPYEGGLFYVHILIPDSHPMRPPVVRFLTRILHPNISFHGDIGLDCIRHNWSLALTLDKVLLSIQSLLTEPYTKVCMEPAIGRLYNQSRDKFEKLAKLWTWKYACHDYLSTDFVSQLPIPDCIV